MDKKVLALVAVILVIGGGVYLYRHNSSPAAKNDEQTETPSTAASEENEAANVAPDLGTRNGDTVEFTVTGSNFAFAPSAMKVKVGDKVKVTFKNETGFHDFRIDEFNVATQKIKAPAEETVEFTADKAGSFE